MNREERRESKADSIDRQSRLTDSTHSDPVVASVVGGLKPGLFSDFFSDKSQSEKSGFSLSIFVTCQKTEG